MEVPEPEVKEEEEDIPLIKAGYTLPSTYPPIQVVCVAITKPVSKGFQDYVGQIFLILFSQF